MVAAWNSVEKYRMFRLKRNFDNNFCKLSWRQHKKSIFLGKTYSTEQNIKNITDVQLLLKDLRTLPVPRKFTRRCFISWFPARVRILECFTESNRQFQCEVMYKNKHKFCLWIYHVPTCRWSSGLATRVSLTRLSRAGWEILLHCVDLLVISVL
jgi:hypothetical protein